MTSAIPLPCPYCQQVFQPLRRNQRYCSSQCRIDANNDQAQKKYAAYRQEAPQAATIQHQLAELKQYIKQQILVILDIDEVDRKTIRWQGRLYQYYGAATSEVRGYHLSLQAGGGIYVVQRDELIYRRKSDMTIKEPAIYKRTDSKWLAC